MSGLFHVLVVDQAPIIDEARDAFQRAYELVSRLKAELYQHESLDLPAYTRWAHSRFGRFLAEGRELAERIGQREEVLAVARDRHWKKFFDGETVMDEVPVRGFEGMNAFWQGTEVHDDDSGDDEEVEVESPYGPGQEERRYQSADGLYDDEEEYNYTEEQDTTRRSEYDFSRSNPGFRSGARAKTRFSSDSEASGPAEDHSSTLSSEEVRRFRVKEAYRNLVRKLHPDHNPQLTSEEKRLWNEVQAAYREKNLVQLELLLALANIFSGKLSRETSLGEVRRSLREVEGLIPALEKKIEAAQKSHAWKFSELDDRDALQEKVEQEFRLELAGLRERLSQVETQIRRFSNS